MDPSRFDAITKVFAGRRTRRQALAGAGGLAAATLAGGLGRSAAQEATPAVASSPPAENEGPVFLFLQAFQAGHIAAKDGDDGRYVLTLEQGLGHTVYFSDRPDRIVGATPTPAFLDGLGFPDDNPPNAALIVETTDGTTEVAVVELFSPAYDEATHTATYEVVVLAEWERTGEAGDSAFSGTAADLSAFGAGFGAAHLFIDDCPNGTIVCNAAQGGATVEQGRFTDAGYCWSWDSGCCKPCNPDPQYYPRLCNKTFPGCANEACWATRYDPSFSCNT